MLSIAFVPSLGHELIATLPAIPLAAAVASHPVDMFSLAAPDGLFYCKALSVGSSCDGFTGHVANNQLVFAARPLRRGIADFSVHDVDGSRTCGDKAGVG